MVKRYRGEKYVQNSKFASRLLINASLPQVEDFRKIIQAQKGPSKPIFVKSPSEHSSSVWDDTAMSSEVKTISELREISQVCCCVVLAKMKSFQTTYGWFYNACVKCNKKVSEEDENVWCDNCKMQANEVIARYKLHVRVEDDSGIASFVLFDPQVSQLLDKSASELTDKLELEGDLECFPDELDQILQKNYLFKIDISKFTLKMKSRVYTVLKLSDDNELISSYQNRASSVTDPSHDITFSSRGIHKTHTDAQKSCVSSVSDNGGSSEHNITPIKKRDAHDVSACVNGEEAFGKQLSTSEKSVRVKTEKLDT